MEKVSRRFVYSFLLGLTSIFLVAFLWANSILLLVCLIFVSILMILVEKDKRDIYLFIFSGIFGASAEAFAILFGAWKYSLLEILDLIPSWLPILWGIAGIFIKRVWLEIENLIKK
ncbi:MAG: hypothetical protein QXS48_03295 [Candidatus Aenigmatarchaeota archaeon]